MKNLTLHAVACLLVVAFGLSTPAAGTTYAVGTCLPKLPSFSTISAAVAGVPAGSIIDVCPGTYSETVTISQALTLQGVTSANSDLVVISGGTMSIPALTVITAGPVNISNIQVQPPFGTTFGVQYVGASGTLNHVSVGRGANGVGIDAFVNDGSSQTVTIKNSSIIMPGSGFGIQATAGPGTLAVTVEGNTIVAAIEGIDVEPCCGGTVTATIQGNFVDGSGGSKGIISGGGLTITGNTVINEVEQGIYSSAGDTVTGNILTGNMMAGITIAGSGGTYTHNTITNSTIGIELNCNTITATGNIFNNDATGFNDVPSSFGTGKNTFFSVSAIKGTVCP